MDSGCSVAVAVMVVAAVMIVVVIITAVACAVLSLIGETVNDNNHESEQQ